MPEIPIVGDANDHGWMLATMLFPDSDLQRQQCFAVHRVRAEILETPQEAMFNVSGETLRLLLESPGYADLKIITAERTKSGVIAGDLLAALYVMDRFNLNPSMNRAIWAAQQYASDGAEFGDGERYPLGERQIRRHWKVFWVFSDSSG
jgi:hypothetical protein